MVIVQHLTGSVEQYLNTATAIQQASVVPEQCPHPSCKAICSLIRWGTYLRNACTIDENYQVRIQRVRCKICGRTHCLLPDFLHPYRRYLINLLLLAVHLYFIMGLGWRQVKQQMEKEKEHPYAELPCSTLREWLRSFAYGAGELLLNLLTRHLAALAPLSELSNQQPPEHFKHITDPDQRRRLEKATHFLLLAEQLYAEVKARQSQLFFSVPQLFPFLLHWLQLLELPQRLFWSPTLATSPTTPF